MLCIYIRRVLLAFCPFDPGGCFVVSRWIWVFIWVWIVCNEKQCSRAKFRIRSGALKRCNKRIYGSLFARVQVHVNIELGIQGSCSKTWICFCWGIFLPGGSFLEGLFFSDGFFVSKMLVEVWYFSIQLPYSWWSNLILFEEKVPTGIWTSRNYSFFCVKSPSFSNFSHMEGGFIKAVLACGRWSFQDSIYIFVDLLVLELLWIISLIVFGVGCLKCGRHLFVACFLFLLFFDWVPIIYFWVVEWFVGLFVFCFYSLEVVPME